MYPPAATPPADTPPPPAPRPGLAIASLVLGILACVSSLFVVGALFGLVGFILGVAHLLRRQGRNGMAWTGLVLSTMGILVGVGMGILVVKFFTSPEFQNEFKKVMAAAGRGAPPATQPDEFGDWVGVAAPDFSVTTLDGQVLKLSELKGKRVVVDFWATWCPPCVEEIPQFIKLRSETSADDLIIVGISSEEAATLKPFVKQKGINYPIASADDLPAPYQDVSEPPTTFFIDRKGVIQNVLTGYHDFEDLKTHALAEDFAGEPKPAPNADQ
jgi:peroxiredoxin